MLFRRVPIPVGRRTLDVDGVRVRARLIRQHDQYYALGNDVKGIQRDGVGKTPAAAYKSLERTLRAVRRAYERRR
jgi:hypothetical protein